MSALEATRRERLLGARNAGITAACGVAAAALVLPFFSILAEAARRAGPPGPRALADLLATARVALYASALAVPVGVGAGVYLAEFGAGRFGRAVRAAADVVGGMPSIVAGVFVYVLVGRSGIGGAALPAAGVALAVMMVPRVARTSDQALREVPGHLREASLGLGVPRWRTLLFVMLRTAAPGVLRGSAVAVARVIGEAAPFLVLGGLRELREPAPLPARIAELGGSAAGWAAAVMLVAIVLSLNVAARAR